MTDYFVAGGDSLNLYKTAQPLGTNELQLYLYIGDCRWKKIADQDGVMPALCKIGNEEAQSVLEKMEGDNYFLLDGQVYVYD